MDKKLTILIPTKGRPDFLERVFKYYKKNPMDQADFIIGDASSGLKAIKCKALCDKFGARYIYCKKKIGETIKHLNEYVETPYVAILPDDDILFPSGTAELIDFLDENPGYHSANGRSIEVILDEPYGEIYDLGEYKLSGIYSETSKRRLYEWKSMILFSIYRTYIWREMWKYSDCFKRGLHDQSVHDEILPICVGVVLGKTAHLDCLFLLRQEHKRRYVGDSWWKWVGSKKFIESRKLFIDSVCDNSDNTLTVSKITKFYDIRYTNNPRRKKRKKINIKILKRIKVAYLNMFVRDLNIKELTKNCSDFRLFRDLVEQKGR